MRIRINKGENTGDYELDLYYSAEGKVVFSLNVTEVDLNMIEAAISQALLVGTSDLRSPR